MVNVVSQLRADAAYSIDCGILRFGWCNGPWCQKLANLKSFLIIFSLYGLIQGACETYFRISTKQTALANDYDPIMTDWLLVSNGLFQMIFAFLITYWGHYYHPINWLSGITILESVSCLIAILPTITNLTIEDSSNSNISSSNNVLCMKTQNNNFLQRSSQLNSEQSETLIIVLLYILQIGIGMGSLAFYTIGIAYIDYNSESIDSAAAIAIAMGMRIIGFIMGTMMSLSLGTNSTNLWLGWVILAPLLFISGILLGLFPKRLTKTVIRQAAQKIINESSFIAGDGANHLANYIDDTAFVATLKRLFRNKLLICNILGISFIQTSVMNFLMQEENYLQSRFLMPVSEVDGLIQEWQARFISYFLKPPIAAMSMVIGGLIISKLKLSARIITAINIAMGIILFVIYISFVFIKCEAGSIAGITNNGKLIQPFCSHKCTSCSPTIFLPVCPENSSITFFSPCYAGCTKHTSINGIQFYEGCSCDQNDYESKTHKNRKATGGACNRIQCDKMWFLFQILSLLGASIYGMTTVGKIIISLRSVLPQDKPMSLAMEMTFVCFFTFLPGKLLYDFISDKTCIYWTLEYSKCLLRENPKHGDFLNLLSAILIFFGIIFDVFVFIFVKGMNIYNNSITDLNYTSLPYALIQSYNDEISGTIVTISSSQPQSQLQIGPSSSLAKTNSSEGVTGSVTNAQFAITTAAINTDNNINNNTNNNTYNNINNNTNEGEKLKKLPILTAKDVQNQINKLKSTMNWRARKSMNSANENRPQSPETNL